MDKHQSAPKAPHSCAERPTDSGNLIAHDGTPTSALAAVGIKPGVTLPAARPHSPTQRHAHTPGANDLFSTQLHMAAALPATDPSPFSSKRREGPFTPRDNLRPNGQFA